jgi:hypothetical protein
MIFNIMTFSIKTLSITHSTIKLDVVKLNVVKLIVVFYLFYAECYYAEWRYAECRGTILDIPYLYTDKCKQISLLCTMTFILVVFVFDNDALKKYLDSLSLENIFRLIKYFRLKSQPVLVGRDLFSW